TKVEPFGEVADGRAAHCPLERGCVRYRDFFPVEVQLAVVIVDHLIGFIFTHRAAPFARVCMARHAFFGLYRAGTSASLPRRIHGPHAVRPNVVASSRPTQCAPGARLARTAFRFAPVVCPHRIGTTRLVADLISADHRKAGQLVLRTGRYLVVSLSDVCSLSEEPSAFSEVLAACFEAAAAFFEAFAAFSEASAAFSEALEVLPESPSALSEA